MNIKEKMQSDAYPDFDKSEKKFVKISEIKQVKAFPIFLYENKTYASMYNILIYFHPTDRSSKCYRFLLSLFQKNKGLYI